MNDPSLHEEELEWSTMKGPPSSEPNLDDILARDFAELKVGEQKLAPPTTQQDEPKGEQPVSPVAYNQRIDAVEDRASFTVKALATKADEPASESEKTPNPTILQAPSAQPGDDFDVDW
jgi:hypothetical protein